MQGEQLIEIETFRSFEFCTENYGHYAYFAVLPLELGSLSQDEYTLIEIRSMWNWSGNDHEKNETFRNFMANLTYHDSTFFTAQEMRFFLKMRTCGYPDLTDEQIERDKSELVQQVTKSTYILKEHAEYMLKAVEFWKLRYKDKIDEWTEE
jgi:hypothetical protein